MQVSQDKDQWLATKDRRMVKREWPTCYLKGNGSRMRAYSFLRNPSVKEAYFFCAVTCETQQESQLFMDLTLQYLTAHTENTEHKGTVCNGM